MAEEEQRGVPKPSTHTPSKSAWGEEVEPQGHPYHLITLITWLGLQWDLVLPPGLLWGPFRLPRGSPGAAPGVSMPPAP